MTEDKKRWQYRFDNYKRAYFLLQEAIEIHQSVQVQSEKIHQLAKEGMIQRFEYCTELAWKTIKDYLENQNVIFKQITPRTVLKEAIAAKFITHGEDWMDALDARNKMIHTYDFKVFTLVIKQIECKYINCFGELYEKLSLEYIRHD